MAICVTNLRIRGIVSAMNFWMVKQEPEAYAFADLVRDGSTAWTGVRNFQARINLRAMRRGDLVFFYHSVSEKQVVGLARLSREAYADPTATEGDWVCVDLKALKALKTPVSLEAIKWDEILKAMLLVRNSRLSVLPVTAEQAERLLEVAQTKILSRQ
jgi:predicted RNA-binding protein with PUA-like domain